MIKTEYRAMTPYDIPEVRALVERTIRKSYRGVYSAAAIEFFVQYHSLESIRSDLEAGTSLVAIDDHIIGTATLRGDLVTRVFVLPENQGQGIGGHLMALLLDRARSSGLKDVRLDASLVSKPMYEHLGFVVVADRRHDLGQGDYLPYHEMMLRL